MYLFRMLSAVLSKRSIGIRPLPNGCFVVGSVGTGFDAVKLPARSSAVGTTPLFRFWLVICRSPPYVPKKNVLFLRIGPPNVPPNWLRCSGVAAGKPHGAAFRFVFRRNSNSDP